MATVVADVIISRRRTLYACCAGVYSSKAIAAKQRGDEKCYLENKRLMDYMLWARSIVDRTPMSTETDDCKKCVSHDLACRIIQKADRFCVACTKCGEPNQVPAPVPPPLPPCEIVSSYTAAGGGVVEGSIAGGDLGAVPAIANTDQYFDWSFSGTGTFLAFEEFPIDNDPPNPPVVIPQGGVWTWDIGAPALGIEVLGQLVSGQTAQDAVTGNWWQLGVNNMWPLFPELTIQVSNGGFLLIGSDEAEQQFGLRQVRIEYTIDNGATWSEVGTWSEQEIYAGVTTAVNPDYSIVTGFRLWYINLDCEYGPFDNPFEEAAIDVFVYVGDSAGTTPVGEELGVYQSLITAPPVWPRTPWTTTTVVFRIVYRIQQIGNTQNLVAGATGTGSLRYTNNGGLTWQEPGGDWNFNAGEFCSSLEVSKDELAVWGIRGGAGLVLSLDNGATFDRVETPDIVAFDQVQSVNGYSTQEVIVGGRDNIWKTTNAGLSWTAVQSCVGCSHVLIMDGDAVLAFDEDGVLRSADRGATWTRVNTTVTNQLDADYSGSTVYTSGGYKSVDGGVTWTLAPLIGPGGTRPNLGGRVKLITPLQVLWSTYESNIFRTRDGGATCENVYDPVVPAPPNNYTLWGLEAIVA